MNSDRSIPGVWVTSSGLPRFAFQAVPDERDCAEIAAERFFHDSPNDVIADGQACAPFVFQCLARSIPRLPVRGVFRRYR
jgi:hypothetical protein